MELTMDEQTLKIIARLTPRNGKWPIGCWVWMSRSRTWLVVKGTGDADRLDTEFSELEANQMGIFRDKTKTESYQTEIYG